MSSIEQRSAPNPEAEKSKEVIIPINKLFIANRGEIAVRAIKTCQKNGIAAVVSYVEPDQNSLATRMAQGLRRVNGNWGTVRINSYLDQENIIEKAGETGCDAIFLGYGFLSENPGFVKKCEDAGMRVLAPPSGVMEKSASKITAKKTAIRLQIPVLDGSINLSTLSDAKIASSELKFPVMLKIPDMGGGKGNRVARNSAELEKEYATLKKRYPESEMFMEHYIENAVHVEIQIAADKYGNVVSLGERDCTMQRGHQKVIEESPSPHITKRMRNAMQEAAIKFAKDIGYQGIGTWEFIIDKDKSSTETVLDKKGTDGNPAWYFMEVNPRIQVEHGITEKQTDVNIVNLMIDIAEGRRLSISQNKIKSKGRKGNTIEVRLCAEKLCEAKDGSQYIAPCPGKISKIYFPEKDENVRVDTGVEDGDEMSQDFDSLIAKIIIHGKNRKEARTKLIDYLRQITVEGIDCNKEFLIDLLNTPEFRNGEATTSFVGNLLKRGKEKLDEAKKGLKENIKKAKRKLRKKATIFKGRRYKKKRNGKKP